MLTFLIGTSCVGKTSLIEALKNNGYATHSCSARVPPKYFGSLEYFRSIGGGVNYDRCATDVDYINGTHSIIFAYFMARFMQIIEIEQSKTSKHNSNERNAIVERSIFDPLIYWYAFLRNAGADLSPNNQVMNQYYTAQDMAINIYTNVINSLNFQVDLIHVPINPSVEYDTLNGIRPPDTIRMYAEEVITSMWPLGSHLIEMEYFKEEYENPPFYSFIVGSIEDYVGTIKR